MGKAAADQEKGKTKHTRVCLEFFMYYNIVFY
jgi:hypothetical protein